MISTILYLFISCFIAFHIGIAIGTSPRTTIRNLSNVMFYVIISPLALLLCLPSLSVELLDRINFSYLKRKRLEIIKKRVKAANGTDVYSIFKSQVSNASNLLTDQLRGKDRNTSLEIIRLQKLINPSFNPLFEKTFITWPSLKLDESELFGGRQNFLDIIECILLKNPERFKVIKRILDTLNHKAHHEKIQTLLASVKKNKELLETTPFWLAIWFEEPEIAVLLLESNIPIILDNRKLLPNDKTVLYKHMAFRAGIKNVFTSEEEGRPHFDFMNYIYLMSYLRNEKDFKHKLHYSQNNYMLSPLPAHNPFIKQYNRFIRKHYQIRNTEPYSFPSIKNHLHKLLSNRILSLQDTNVQQVHLYYLLACTYGDLESVKQFIKNNTLDFLSHISPISPLEQTGLTQSIKRGHPEIAKFLIQSGAIPISHIISLALICIPHNMGHLNFILKHLPRSELRRELIVDLINKALKEEKPQLLVNLMKIFNDNNIFLLKSPDDALLSPEMRALNLALLMPPKNYESFIIPLIVINLEKICKSQSKNVTIKMEKLGMIIQFMIDLNFRFIEQDAVSLSLPFQPQPELERDPELLKPLVVITTMVDFFIQCEELNELTMVNLIEAYSKENEVFKETYNNRIKQIEETVQVVRARANLDSIYTQFDNLLFKADLKNVIHQLFEDLNSSRDQLTSFEERLPFLHFGERREQKKKTELTDKWTNNTKEVESLYNELMGIQENILYLAVSFKKRYMQSHSQIDRFEAEEEITINSEDWTVQMNNIIADYEQIVKRITEIGLTVSTILKVSELLDKYGRTAETAHNNKMQKRSLQESQALERKRHAFELAEKKRKIAEERWFKLAKEQEADKKRWEEARAERKKQKEKHQENLIEKQQDKDKSTEKCAEKSIDKSTERSIDKSKEKTFSKPETKALAENYATGKSKKHSISRSPKPLTIGDTITIELEETLHQLEELDILKRILETSEIKTVSELRAERNAILGTTARIMENYLRFDLPYFPVSLARKFRNAIFHGHTLFPEVGEDLKANHELNERVRKLAQEMLHFIKKHEREDFKVLNELSVLQGIDCDLFLKIVSFEPKKPSFEECQIQLSIGKYELELYSTQQEQNTLPRVLLDAALGFTYARLGTYIKEIERNYRHLEEAASLLNQFSEYVTPGKNFRHGRKLS